MRNDLSTSVVLAKDFFRFRKIALFAEKLLKKYFCKKFHLDSLCPSDLVSLGS